MSRRSAELSPRRSIRLAGAALALLLTVVGCSADSNDASGTGGAVGTGGSGGQSASGGSTSDSGGAGSSGAGGTGTGGAGTGGATNATDASAVDVNAPDARTTEGGGAAGRRDNDAGGAAGSRDSGPSPSEGGASDGASESGRDAAIAYNPCPTTANMPCAVLPLGDSITEGFASSGAGYRVELFRQAVVNGKNLTFVGSLLNGPAMVQNRTFPQRHEGHDGFTIDTGTGHSGISGMITDQAMANFRPAIVLLMIGTNDLNGNIDIANAPVRLGALIDEITNDNPSTLVVVASIIPIVSANTNQRVLAYNAAIPGLVNSRAIAGKHVVFVDNYTAIGSNANYQTTLMADNLHPNDAGYAILGRSFYGVIAPLLPAGP